MTKIKFQKQVFNKTAFNETVDTNFTQLISTPDPNFFDINLATLEDFWQLYERFFYVIPKFGDIESHEYLAKASGEYVGQEIINQQIQDLLDEIASLREENLRIMTDALNLNEEGIGQGGFGDNI
jgi:hypothetical protein